MSVDDYPYLIIGGTTKAGTTSLFKYLADHPDICASSLKETRFFLDQNYPLPSSNRFSENNIDAYGEFFLELGKLRVEATPDYLYSKAALNIGNKLANVRFIFILRDPVDRLVSWFKFAKQKGMMSQGITFDEYVAMQMGIDITAETPVHLRALEQGKYCQYLELFRDKYSKNIFCILFSDLATSPQKVMFDVCGFAEISKEVYTDYKFTVENKTVRVKSQRLEKIYTALRRNFSFALYKYPLFKSILRGPNRVFKQILNINKSKALDVKISDEMLHVLREFYDEEYKNIFVNEGLQRNKKSES